MARICLVGRYTDSQLVELAIRVSLVGEQDGKDYEDNKRSDGRMNNHRNVEQPRERCNQTI